MRKDVLQWLIPVLLAIALAAALAFYWWQSNRPASDIEPDIRTDPREAAARAPRPAPEAPPESSGEVAAGQPELRPLRPLAERDEDFSLVRSELFGPALAERLVEQNLVERVGATIDTVPREQI